MIEVTCIDHMGTDLSVVNAARVSFNKKSTWAGQEDGLHDGEGGMGVLNTADSKLIRYLAKHKHMSPFGHCFASFHVKAPVFVARQLVKHKFLRWNEISRRYVDHEPEFYQPTEWRGRSVDAKQGSEGVVTLYEDHQMRQAYHPTEINVYSLETYNYLLEQGVAPEQARMVLPQSMMTEWYWSGTLYAFAKMCGLRLKEDTQAETRVVAEKVEDVMMKLYPVSWEALRMYEE